MGVKRTVCSQIIKNLIAIEPKGKGHNLYQNLYYKFITREPRGKGNSVYQNH